MGHNHSAWQGSAQYGTLVWPTIQLYLRPADSAGRMYGSIYQPHPNLTPTHKPNGIPNPIKTEYWDRAGGGGNISYEW